MVDENYTPEYGEPWADNELLPAEKILLTAAKVGEVAHISDYKPAFLVPWRWKEQHQIRADFLRYLLTHPTVYQLDPKGFRVFGAHLTGTLNLENLKIEHRLGFARCWFTETPLLLHARTRTISFHNCRLPGLRADCLNVDGGLSLQNSTFEGEVRVLGARVEKDVPCTGARFTCKDNLAFNADGLHVGGSLFLNKVTVEGSTRLLGAEVKGDVSCTGATFVNPGGAAFHAQRLTVDQRLFFRAMKARPVGEVDLAHAHVGDLLDDESAWPNKDALILDGLVYDNLPHHYGADTRKSWLALQPGTNDQGEPAFWPQPYEQLIKVLKAAGHERDARQIAIDKQKALQKYLRQKATIKNKDTQGNELTTYVICDQRYLRRSWLWFTGWSIRYGYEPWRATYFLFAAFVFGLVAFLLLDLNGLMQPAKERIYTHACYTNKAKCPHWVVVNHRAGNGDLRYVPPDYPDFNPFVYSLDVLLPIVDMKLESHWMPGSRGFWGTLGRVYFWLHIALGWIFTTIAVVGFTGLVKQDKD